MKANKMIVRSVWPLISRADHSVRTWSSLCTLLSLDSVQTGHTDDSHADLSHMLGALAVLVCVFPLI